MDDFFRTQQSPRGEAQVGGVFVSPPRNGPMLPRRFTTDSGRVPTLSSLTTIPRAAPEPQDFASTTVRSAGPMGSVPQPRVVFSCSVVSS